MASPNSGGPTGGIPMMHDDRIRAIAELAAAARGFSLHEVKAPAESTGLPTQVQVGFDHRRTGQDAIVDLNPILEKYRRHPERRVGTAKIETLQSFIALVNRHKSKHSVIFADCDLPDPAFTAVIDYHEKENGNPAFLKHRVHYGFPLTEEFKEWQNNDQNEMGQGEFAAFIEERIAEIASADEVERRHYADLFRTTIATPSEMMMLSRGLEVSVNSGVKQAIKLQSGEAQITFTEEHNTSVTVPGLFIVSVPVFLAGVPVRLVARLRYRVKGGNLVWFYQLYRVREFVRDRVLVDLHIAAKETELPVYEGSPEA